MLILSIATNEGLCASFVEAFEDERVSETRGLPKHFMPIVIIAVG